jgi:hypothetical protein
MDDFTDLQSTLLLPVSAGSVCFGSSRGHSAKVESHAFQSCGGGTHE